MTKYKEVFVDVFPWISAISDNLEQTNIPMCGVFRHAEALTVDFSPAVVILPTDVYKKEAITRLSKFLGKDIQVLHVEDKIYVNDVVYEFGCRVWISLCPDGAGPAVNEYSAGFKRLTIVHDLMAAEGKFSQRQQENYHNAIQYSDAFAFVSNTVLEEFKKFTESWKRDFESIAYINYGNFHMLPKFQVINNARDVSQEMCLSVHSLYAYKNVHLVSEIARYLSVPHTHVGRFMDISEKEVLYATTLGTHFLGGISDELLHTLYWDTYLFACMSSNEGFSVPPLEAMIRGTDRMILSDIPVHREIYGHIPEIVFLNTEDSVGDQLNDQGIKLPKHLPIIPIATRRDMFRKYSFPEVSKYLYGYAIEK